MGLPFACMFYAAYLYVLFFILKWLPMGLRITFMGIFFMIEIKEPFLFKYSLMFFLLLMYFSHVLVIRNRISGLSGLGK